MTVQLSAAWLSIRHAAFRGGGALKSRRLARFRSFTFRVREARHRNADRSIETPKQMSNKSRTFEEGKRLFIGRGERGRGTAGERGEEGGRKESHARDRPIFVSPPSRRTGGRPARFFPAARCDEPLAVIESSS